MIFLFTFSDHPATIVESSAKVLSFWLICDFSISPGSNLACPLGQFFLLLVKSTLTRAKAGQFVRRRQVDNFIARSVDKSTRI